MRPEEVQQLVCPACHNTLALQSGEERGGEVWSGVLRCPEETSYLISSGVPDLTYPRNLPPPDAKARKFYDGRAEDYDKYLHLTFKTHGEDEQSLRNKFIDALQLEPSSRVLELACGTGRDSQLIANRLGQDGMLCVQDISSVMLERCRERLAKVPATTSYSISNACFLPYPDNTFDALYSFGGLGEFSDIKRSLAEVIRVCKVGARVVVGDESMPPWLRDTDFAGILVTTNKQFLADVPLADIPVEARDVCLRWVIGGVFYLIEFRVGESEPEGDFDFEIPGVRGGTLRTRYEGQLEGVTPEAKQLAHLAREKRGVSMHKWLDEVVREAACRDLQQDARED